MSNFVRSSLILFETHFLFALRSKRFVMCALLAAIPVGFAFTLTQVFGPDEELPVTLIAWMLIGQVVCPLTALIFASALISEEVEDRTISYLFSRPIPRASLLVGRWLASMVVKRILSGWHLGGPRNLGQGLIGGGLGWSAQGVRVSEAESESQVGDHVLDVPAGATRYLSVK